MEFGDYPNQRNRAEFAVVGEINRLDEFESRLEAIESLQPRINALEGEVQRLPQLDYQTGRGLYAGFEHVIVKPYFSRNIAFTEASTSNFRFTSFDWNATHTPRVFVAFEGDGGVGLVVSYWQFDDQTRFSRTQLPGEFLFVEVTAADQSVNNLAGPGGVSGTLLGSHSVKLDVLDIEFTKRADQDWGWFAAQAGIRYGRLEQAALWTETGSPDFVALNFDFEGIGPTLKTEVGAYVIGGLAVFANMRGSLLYGNRSIRTEDNLGGDFIPSYDSLQPTLEGQVGLDWRVFLFGYPVTVRAAVEGQTWFRGGGASGGDDEGIPSDQLDLGFFGGSFSTVIEL